MRAMHLALFGLLGIASAIAAAPEWACSAPNTRNPYCPLEYQGDNRCSTEYCPPYAGCTAQDCNTLQGNIKADSVIALDAYVVKGEQCVLSTVSAAECCNLCKLTAGCNAWSYCNRAEGCGSGCFQSLYGFDQARLSKLGADINVTDSPSRLNAAHSCTSAGLWPYGVCSLKYLTAEHLGGQVPMTPGNQDGWISGMPAAAALAWHEQSSEGLLGAAEPAPANLLANGPAAAAAVSETGSNTQNVEEPQALSAHLQEPAAAAAAGHTSTEAAPDHTLTAPPGDTTSSSPPRGQQFPEGDLQYLNPENAPIKPGMITGPQDVLYYAARPTPPPAAAAPVAAPAAVPASKAAGNAAAAVRSSSVQLLLAGLMAMLVCF